MDNGMVSRERGRDVAARLWERGASRSLTFAVRAACGGQRKYRDSAKNRSLPPLTSTSPPRAPPRPHLPRPTGS